MSGVSESAGRRGRTIQIFNLLSYATMLAFVRCGKLQLANHLDIDGLSVHGQFGPCATVQRFEMEADLHMFWNDDAQWMDLSTVLMTVICFYGLVSRTRR